MAQGFGDGDAASWVEAQHAVKQVQGLRRRGRGENEKVEQEQARKRLIEEGSTNRGTDARVSGK